MKSLMCLALVTLFVSGCARCPEVAKDQDAAAKPQSNSAERAIQTTSDPCSPASARAQDCQPRYSM